MSRNWPRRATMLGYGETAQALTNIARDHAQKIRLLRRRRIVEFLERSLAESGSKLLWLQPTGDQGKHDAYGAGAGSAGFGATAVGGLTASGAVVSAAGADCVSAFVGEASMPGGVALKNANSRIAPSSVMPIIDPISTRKFIRLRLPCFASVGDTTIVLSDPMSECVTANLL